MKHFQRPLLASYRSDEITSKQVQVISSSHPQIPSGPIDLLDLLSTNCRDVGEHRTLIQGEGKRAFFVWAREALELSPWTFEDAVTHCQNFLQRRDAQSTTFLYTFDHVVADKENAGRTQMISIIGLKSEEAQSISLSFRDRDALEASKWSAANVLSQRSSFVKQNLAFILTALFLVLMGAVVAAFATLAHRQSDPDLWMHWDTKDTEGPNQLQYTYPHPNFTTWAAETRHDIDDWFVRIDDQSMIPSSLVDDDERRYQEWFRSHYPEWEAIRANKDYLNETFYKHYNHQHAQLRIDRDFHVTHCILVMKRYWRARKTAHHVCPRDVDDKHINHCFGVLEHLAIADLPGIEHAPEQTNGTWNPWIVNACF